jgi:hypothetical protein
LDLLDCFLLSGAQLGVSLLKAKAQVLQLMLPTDFFSLEVIELVADRQD